MTKIGYAIFGRPIGLEVLSNGLFKEEGLDAELYLDSDKYINLDEGETIGIVRQFLSEGGEWMMMVAIGTHAKSFGEDRPGGFVGCAVCFKGQPNPVITKQALPELHRAALELIDSTTKKFKDASVQDWDIELIPVNDEYYIPKGNERQESDKDTKKIGVAVEGPAEDHVHAVAEGVYYNPVFNKFKTVLFSNQDSCINKFAETKKLFELVDYSEEHEKVGKELENVRKELENVRKELENERVRHKGEVEKNRRDEQNQLEEIQSKIDSENARLEEKTTEREKEENRYNEYVSKNQDLQEQSRNAEDDLNEAISNLEEKQINLGKLEDAFNIKSNEILNDDSLKKEFENQAKLEYFFIKRRLIKRLLMGLLLLVLVVALVFLGIYIGDKIKTDGLNQEELLLKTAQNGDVGQEQNVDRPQNDEELAVRSDELMQSWPGAPEELDLDSVLHLDVEDRMQVVSAVAKYVQMIDSICSSFGPDDMQLIRDHPKVKEFTARKWHFAELLNTEKAKDQDPTEMGLTIQLLEGLLTKIFDLESDFSVVEPLDSLEIEKGVPDLMLLIPNAEGKLDFSVEKYEFNSASRFNIYNHYLDEDFSIFRDLDFHPCDDEEDPGLLYFRWILYEISELDDFENDIFPTNSTEHNIPKLKSNI
jgi:hypothetical protein